MWFEILYAKALKCFTTNYSLEHVKLTIKSIQSFIKHLQYNDNTTQNSLEEIQINNA